MKDETSSVEQVETLQLKQAYERAMDENIISSITDTKGLIVHVNKKFCETSKYSSSELVGQNHRIVNSGFHSKEFFKDMWQTIGQGKVWHDEIRNKASDGTHYWVDTVIVPIRNSEDSRNTHYLSLRTLITERKLLEQEKEQHLGSLEALLVITSQRVRGPVAASLRQMSLLDSSASAADLNEIMISLKATVLELDSFTRELSTFIRDMKV
jgi:PAS domain S-box-containing protein